MTETTTISPEQQKILELQEQIGLLQVAVERLQNFATRSTPPGSCWILVESRFHQNFPTTNPIDNSSHSISCGEWHVFPAPWRNHLRGLKESNDRNGEFATYQIALHES